MIDYKYFRGYTRIIKKILRNCNKYYVIKTLKYLLL